MGARRIVGRLGVSFAILASIAVVGLLPLFPPIVLPQHRIPVGQDSAIVIAGERYRAGRVRRFLNGWHYRYLWTEPIKVEVLDLGKFGGGLRPTTEGGGNETLALHFVGGSGRDYVFRSLDKELKRLVGHGLARSLLTWMIQDQSSSGHPAAPLIVAPLQAAVGLPSGDPRLVLLPADSSLGQFRDRFGGLLGTLELEPEDYSGVRHESGDSVDVRHSLELLPLLDSTTTNRIDSVAYLEARLFDFFLNDWDRHEDQWRWVARPKSWGTLWQPIPVDRDQAFSWYDGLVMDILRIRSSKLSNFGPEYPPVAGLTRNSKLLDQRLLGHFDRRIWDSVAAFLVERLTDSVIDAAVRQMPEPYWRLSGPRLAAVLKERRARLPDIAAASHDRLRAESVNGRPAPGSLVRQKLRHHPPPNAPSPIRTTAPPPGARRSRDPW